MATKAAVFDFDNTLLLSEQCKANTIREIVSEYEGGLEVLEGVPQDARFVPAGVVVSRHTIFRDVAARLHARGVRPGAADESAEAFGVRMCDRFSELVQERLSQAAEVPGTTAMLQHLKAQGLPCYVNSATPQAPLERCVGWRLLSMRWGPATPLVCRMAFLRHLLCAKRHDACTSMCNSLWPSTHAACACCRSLVEALGWREYFVLVMGQPGTKTQNLASVAAREVVTSAQVVLVGDGNNDCCAAREFGCPFIGVHDEGAAAPADAFSGPVHAIAKDMHQAGAMICALAELPPPTQ